MWLFYEIWIIIIIMSDWWCFLSDFIQTILMFTFNMLSCLMENHFLQFHNTTNSLTYKVHWHYKYMWFLWNMNINQCLEWLMMLTCWFQPNYCYVHLLYAFAWWKIIFYNSKTPQTHLLMRFTGIIITCDILWNMNYNQCLKWLVMLPWWFQPNYCCVPLICFCLMENHFLKFKNTTNS